MKLPEDIEREIREAELACGAQGGQQAGLPRLRGLRSVIERQAAELKAARAVLDRGETLGGYSTASRVDIQVDRAAWLAWQARGKP